jgi:uncharacterized protein (DUF302 family)
LERIVSVKQIAVERFSVTSSKPFDEIVKALEATIGRSDLNAFGNRLKSAKSFQDVETIVNEAVGPSGLMEFSRFDLGAILRKERGSDQPRILRLVVGNPLIMKKMVERVVDAGSYAPVTILVDERADGVHLSYDRMASFLGSYQNEEALKVARELDAKVEALLNAAAQ